MFVDKRNNNNSTFDSTNLKSNTKLSDSETLSKPRTKNPVDELELKEEVEPQLEVGVISSKNFKFALLVIFLVISSFILNPFFSKNLEPLALKYFSMLFNKPYILTVGEFKDFSTAKNNAVKLLPELKQINIKQLSTGAYTFEIEKFTSKEKAYKESTRLKQGGFDSVHVRYLPD
jgi:hypothetical protein